MDLQLRLFRRQYLQLFQHDFLSWPPKGLLKEADVQKWLYRNMFSPDCNDRLPPERYQFRVLKTLVTKIEQSVEDPEEDVSDMFGPSLTFRPSLHKSIPPRFDSSTRRSLTI